MGRKGRPAVVEVAAPILLTAAGTARAVSGVQFVSCLLVWGFVDCGFSQIGLPESADGYESSKSSFRGRSAGELTPNSWLNLDVVW